MAPGVAAGPEGAEAGPVAEAEPVAEEGGDRGASSPSPPSSSPSSPVPPLPPPDAASAYDDHPVLLSESEVTGVDPRSPAGRAAAAALRGRPGGVAGWRRVSRDARRLFNTGWFSSVRPSARDARDGVQLRVDVVPNHTVRRVVVSGTRRLPSAVVERATAPLGNRPLNVAMAQRAAREINAWYDAAGGLSGCVVDARFDPPTGTLALVARETALRSVGIGFRGATVDEYAAKLEQQQQQAQRQRGAAALGAVVGGGGGGGGLRRRAAALLRAPWRRATRRGDGKGADALSVAPGGARPAEAGTASDAPPRPPAPGGASPPSASPSPPSSPEDAVLPQPIGRDGDDVIFASGYTRAPVLLRRLSALRPGSTLSREAIRTAVGSLAGTGLLEDVQVRVLPVPELREVESNGREELGEERERERAAEVGPVPEVGAEREKALWSRRARARRGGAGGEGAGRALAAPSSGGTAPAALPSAPTLEPVSLAPWSSYPPAEADLLLLVKESRGGSLGAGGGLSTSRSGKAGLVGQLSAAHSNVFGTGQRLALEVDVGLSDSSFKLQHVDPWIRGDSYGTSRSISLLRERVPLAFDPWGVFGAAARNGGGGPPAGGSGAGRGGRGGDGARLSPPSADADAEASARAPPETSAAPDLSALPANRPLAAAAPPATPASTPAPPQAPQTPSRLAEGSASAPPSAAHVPTVTRSTGAVEWSRRLSRDVSASFALRLARSAVADLAAAGRPGGTWSLLGGGRPRQRRQRAAPAGPEAGGAEGDPRAAEGRRVPPPLAASSGPTAPCDTSATVCWSLSWASPDGSAGAVAQVAQAAPLLPGWLGYARGTMRTHKDVSLGRHAGLHLTGSLGGHAGDLPPYEAFPLGGTNTVRGYAEGGIGVGSRYATGGVELRVPIAAGLSGTLFGDVGSVLGTQNALRGRAADAHPRAEPGGGAEGPSARSSAATALSGPSARAPAGASSSIPSAHPSAAVSPSGPSVNPTAALALLPPLEPAVDAASAAPAGLSVAPPSGILASSRALPAPVPIDEPRRLPPGTGAGVGVGVRLDTPLGPLRLEYAWNDRLEPRLHIGVGSEGLKAW